MTSMISLQGGPGVAQVRRMATEVPGPRSRELTARRAKALPAGLVSGAGVYAAAAGGGVLVDVDGNSFIDLGSGIAVTTVGNSAPAVVSRVTAQAQRFTHTCFLATPYEQYLEVAETLNRITPGDHEKRTALFNTGAEAVENAVKYARVATARPAVVVFDHAFHGRSLMTMTMTAKQAPYRRGFGPFAPEVYRAPMAHPYRWPSGTENCAADAFRQFASLVDNQIGAEAVACVVVEPIQGEGGFIVPAPGFLAMVADFCRARGILLVADEVQTGIARTGAWFASEHEQVVPDLITTAKGLAGGLPLAAVTGRADIMDAAHPGGIGGTFSGNPLSCAAALGVFEEVETHDLLTRAADIGEVLVRELGIISAETGIVGDIRGRGAMIAAELVVPGTEEPNREAVAEILRFCQNNGVLALSAGTYGNVLRFLPPLSLPDELLREALTVLRDAFRSL
ncbi:4-aminobutyrate--2-oxoglutarate transaminase [Mycobacteroides franklinii]|uniref:(S)-3-amino-2-methylpropionate transaminase n=1 Tax=Mycobacteroides franklinii TaxID=948102 RepID=A0A4R5P5M2_9MYCO|nr:4-aminobutyrate--2-oxoglutarate transaminase [Mycobacteroides franklinii]ORA56036.1 4-aminobutyrate--2-oxoglutarate transaminase [Mycobacteroides franklinii]TDH18730.1 4-aminobutyrate--2-oxoglutarate transaminase [Mycobacteroides franklinii]TDZ46361.1 4-aminobutyrate aminotransferase GabT [Mycobacteroides franklinii]TDZ47870.1 4-aminobutyrate aminotransferase GabT [Mycobacteroides franklinii]TDZ60079.1 4-aminobutyrate aminotransferase GabT [Mycobacteroides franklinii]